MGMNLNLGAVLWDMDGVIVDTFIDHYRSWQQTMDELNQPYNMDLFRKTFGMNNRLILTLIFDRELEEDFIQRVSDRKEVLFRQMIHGHVTLFPGVAEWLKQFELLGIKQAVASSAPQANIEAILDELGIHQYFQAEVAGASLQGKPDPAVFLLAARRLGIDPAHCLVIEDSIAGVEAARRGGMKCVAVLTTNDAEKLQAADIVVKDLSFLDAEALDRLFGS
ncbi:MAG: HAD family phosphatase [Chloroflexi bacterium]|nr:HAD family phosphatase [Chloroflexota bacterium]